MRVPHAHERAGEHRRALFDRGAVADDVQSEDEGLDPVDRGSADSFPASDPPATSSPAA
jgi:hypothetical protein